MTELERKPKVSVCVITYNQRKYIRQCLQSIVDQKADFAFEVIVGDDCSTDGTRAIVQEFADRHPTMIKVILQDRNTLGVKNNLDVHRAATAEYIAHMDGDDYALPGKLQKQVDFLDRYQHCSLVCHRVRTISEDGKKVLGVRPAGRQPIFTDLDRLVRQYAFFAASSKMYRRSASVFDHSASPPRIDFFSHVEHASLGEIGFLPEILGCNRRTAGGITGATGEKLYFLFDSTLDAFERARQLGVKDATVDSAKARYMVGAAALCLFRDDVDGYRRYLVASRIDGRRMSFSHATVFLMRDHVRVVRALLRSRALLVRWAQKWSRFAAQGAADA